MREGLRVARLVRAPRWASTARTCGWSATTAAAAASRGPAAATSSRSTPPRSSRRRSRPSSPPATSAARATRVRAFEWFLGRNRLRAVGLRLRHRRLPRRPRRADGQRQRGRRVDARLPPGAARARRRRPAGDAARMKLALLGPIAWRTPPRHYGPWELVTGLLADGLVARGVDVTLFATLDSITLAQLDGVCARPYEEDPRGRRTRLGGAARRPRAAAARRDFDLIHNHLDWLPLAFAGLRAAPRWSPRSTGSRRRGSCPPTGARRAPSSRSPTPTARPGSTTSPRSTTASTPRRCRSPPAGGDGARVLRAHPPRQGHRRRRSRSRARAERPLVLCGPVQDERYFAEEVEPHVDGDRVRYLGSVGPRGARRGPRRGGLPPAPDRVRRAVRALGGGVDAVRHPGRRLRPRVDARDRRGRRHRRARRRRRRPRSPASSAPPRSTAPPAARGALQPLLGRPHGRRLPRRLREASSRDR